MARFMQNPFQANADMGFDEAAELIAEEEKPEVGLELHVGSNIFRSTNGVIKFQGKEQIVLEVQPDPPALFLTMDFYDEQGLGFDKVHGNAVILTMDMNFREA